MRKALASIIAAGCLVSPAAAHADEEIVAAAPNRYTTPEVSMDQGEPLNFRNTDPNVRHDVVSEDIFEGKPLFRSETIGFGTSFVEGSQYLKTGSYEFFCSLHSNMRGTLTVTSAGTPAPRPGASPTPTPSPSPSSNPEPSVGDTTAPAVSLNVGTLVRASKLKQARKLVLKVGSDEAGKVRVVVKLGSRTLSRAAGTIEAGTTRRITLPFNRTARGLLKKGRKLSITATVTDASGNVGTARTTAPLR